MDEKSVIFKKICEKVAKAAIRVCPSLTSFAFIIQIDEYTVSNEGYAYTAQNEWEPFSISQPDFGDLARSFLKASLKDAVDARVWSECLIQMRRDGKTKAEFCYDPAGRWLGPVEDLDDLPERLRPVFD